MPVVNNQRDGLHRMTIDKGKTAYTPNSLNDGYPKPDLKEGYVHYPEKVAGQKVRVRSETFQEHFGQAILFWNSMSEPEKQHIIEAFHFEVGKVTDKATRQKVVDMFNNVDNELAKAIALGVGANPPAPIERHMPKVSMSKALSLENTAKNSIATRKIAALIMDGFEDAQLAAVKAALTSQGAHLDVISQFLSPVKSASGKTVVPDKNYVSVSSVLYDAVYIPGGEESVEAMIEQDYVVNFITEAYKHCKPMGATGEGVNLLAELGLVDSEAAGTKSNQVVEEMGVVTLMDKPNDAFNKAFVEAIKAHRHWARETAENIPA